MIPVENIRPSPLNPRKRFDPDELRKLADSIHAHGVLQPILVRPWPARDESWSPGQEATEPPTYQIVAGERRWRASCIADSNVIPAVVRDLTDRELLEI